MRHFLCLITCVNKSDCCSSVVMHCISKEASMRAKQFLCLITTEYRRVGQDQLPVEFFIVLSTHIWIQVKRKDTICCLKYFGEYTEAYQKANSFLDFMLCLSDNDQTDIMEAFNSSSRYLDVLLNIYNLILNKW